jgi:probable phosphoglycerate mutase
MELETATRVVLVRHGETDWNRVGRIQGHTDIPLNALGLRQADRVGAALADEAFDAIYSSDLQRAHRTALAIAAGRAGSVRVDPGLRERAFGRFEGRTWEEIQAIAPDEALRWRQREPDFEVGGGESLRRFSARCVGTALRLAAAHPGGQIVLVAHGGVLDCLYRAATGTELQAPRSWQVANATVNRVLAGESRLSLIGWNDDAHLAGLALDDAAA